MKFIFLLFGFSFVFGQNNTQLDSLNEGKRDLFIKKFEISNQVLIDQVATEYQGKTSKILKQNLESFSEEFSTEIKEDNFYFNEKFIENVTEILEE